MARQDLLALSIDDLAAMTNRGTVKRAQRELDAGDPTPTVEEVDAHVRVQWSDGIVCEFPAGGTLDDATCSSGAVGVSRHIIRSVLAYQAFAPAQTTEQNAEAESVDDSQAADSAANDRWDPGTISDDDLLERFGKRAVSKARRRFEDGVLAELIRSSKPFVRFLDRPCVVRFLVPGDVRYVHSDCAESALPEFVCHAVWAFRELDPASTSGVLSTQQSALPIPTEVLDAIEELARDLCVDGIGRLTPSWKARLARCERACRDQGLVWPAELICDVQQQAEAYQQHDAQFDPYNFLRFVGELLIRGDAIRSGQTEVPQLLVRGTLSDRVTEIAGSRLIGVGCDARTGKGTTTITAFLQDSDTGVMMAYGRVFPDGEDEKDPPKPFTELAASVVYKGSSLSQFGSGQLIIKSGKRSPSHRITLPRTAGAVALNPQSFSWENLRPPHFVESFAEVKARLELLPPASLRPRRPTENVFICPVQNVTDVEFDVVSQQLTASIEDAAGEQATLQHRFSSRGQAGFERLANELTEHGDCARFVSGQMLLSRRGLEVRPFCVVLESGGSRYAIQPWIDAGHGNSSSVEFAELTDGEHSPIAEFRARWHAAVADVLVTGLRQASPSTNRSWRELADDSAAIGFARIASAIRQFSNQLGQQMQSLRWDPRVAAESFLQQVPLLVLMDDLAT